MIEKKILARIILKLRKGGKSFIPTLLPADITRGEVGTCFDHCVVECLKSNGKYRYVEGIARVPLSPDEWIVHAWLTDGVFAYDPTWRAFDKIGMDIIIPTEYTGIEMDIKKVVKFMKKTGYQSVLANHWRNPKLAAEIFQKS